MQKPFWLSFLGTWAVKISCEHNADISFLNDMANVFANTFLFTLPALMSNIIIHLELCFWPPGECKSNIHSLLALFLVSTNS